MSGGTHTHWRMTINNYDETDLALVQQGYPDYIRQLVYTLEEGEEGTPHIQAYIKMKRDTRFSAMKKLFPRGNFAFIDNNEYKLNSQRYAQKLDDTARSPAVITNFEPIHTIEGLVRRVIMKMIDDYPDVEDMDRARSRVERDMVIEEYTVAKIFVSATYKQMWKQFGSGMYQCLFTQRHNALIEEERMEREKLGHTHTHTHTDEIFSLAEGIHDAEDSSSEDGEAYSEEGEDDEGDDDSGSSETEASSESDDHGCSESDVEPED